ncbi:bifunctional indole-3-glycerol-phosphate synthase TrpC/phosphoribosylanthranilate isomerase TrpF [Rheinheimera sp.]|uniref:bifunctional indole-3-glycerol-phosphate synthase TrpC/phosphoribosylanthranilate isomerase TrpF n=1 Tax=Rheinheimera sp. TaxID=1869214 RepID=UPI0027B9C4C2|nr:bifunctional indole-3-glycerol-phosphate synthase TrpC/phosphoribosylanthranilate isomerase TrpF [Rheinheimera sp.]
MANVLENIINHKRLEVSERKITQPLETFIADVKPTSRKFLQALLQPGARFILECKKASPSKGLIRANFDLDEIAVVYGKYADCISVLTDEKFFQGSYTYLASMRQKVSQPLLHKDFIIDPYQIYLGRLNGADAVLLMLSVLTDDEYQKLAKVAHELGMTVLTEVSNEAETFRAVALKAELIGINNRDLRTLTTNLDTSFRLARLIPPGTLVVSESGIYFNPQVRKLRKVAKAFLVGSALMAEPDLENAVRALVLGTHKVCGLTTAEQAQTVYQAGAYYGGLIFYPASPRAVNLAQATSIIAAAPLNFVGVFVNETAEQVAMTAHELELSAVQLHGDEDDEYLFKLRALLPKTTAIWKAYRVKDKLPVFTQLADKVVLDSYQQGLPGGTGVRFDWALLQQQFARDFDNKLLLAGGLSPDNVIEALPLPVAGLDMNSGLESAPGVKDPAKIANAFQQIREFSYD